MKKSNIIIVIIAICIGLGTVLIVFKSKNEEERIVKKETLTKSFSGGGYSTQKIK